MDTDFQQHKKKSREIKIWSSCKLCSVARKGIGNEEEEKL